MLSTDPRELTDAQTRELVRRGIAKGRRMNATRRAVSGAAALAVVGALGAGTFALVSSMNQDVTPAAPASPPATSPASPGSAPSRPPAATRLLSSELLAPTLEEQLPAGSTVTIPEDTAEAGYSASASVPTDDGHATVLVDLIDWRQGDRLAEWGFAHPVPGHPDVWFVSGTADAKQGKNSWYLQREDGATVWFRVLTVARVGEDDKGFDSISSTSPFDDLTVATLLDAPAWGRILDDALAG